MTHRRLIYTITLIMILSILALGLSSAQTIPADKLVTVDLKDVPILAAAASILKGTDIGYMCDKGVVASVSINMKDTPIVNALTALLVKSNTTGRIENGIFIISQRPAKVRYAFPIEKTTTKVRVGLTYAVGKIPSVSIASSGPADIIEARNGRIITVIGSEQATLNKTPNGIEVVVMGKSYGIVNGPVRIEPASDMNVFAITSPKTAYSKYSGTLEAIPGDGKMMTLVDEVPLEDYVRGVLPAEASASFNPEAQKALTLAIRTYAMTNGRRHEAEGFNVCDSTDCQGFAGASRESEWVDKLLADTKNQVIASEDAPIHAMYSTDCGGITQSNKDAGAGYKDFPYLVSVVDAENGIDFCAASPNHIWSKLLTQDDLKKAFSRYQSMKLGAFKKMEFSGYDSSGRITSVSVLFEQGESKISGPRFREIFGRNVIKSTKITLVPNTDGSYLVSGKGFGHGIGMCINGANGLAKAHPEYTYQDILKFYYKGIEVMQINSNGSLSPIKQTLPSTPATVKPESPSVVKPPVSPVAPQPAKPVIDTPQPPAPVIKTPGTSSASGPPALAGRAANRKK